MGLSMINQPFLDTPHDIPWLWTPHGVTPLVAPQNLGVPGRMLAVSLSRGAQIHPRFTNWATKKIPWLISYDKVFIMGFNMF